MLIDGVWITPAMTREVAELTGTHQTTVTRWMQRGKLPGAVRRLLRILYHGDLGLVHDTWSGWRMLEDGRLSPPNGDQPFSPGHLLAMGLTYQQLSAAMLELDELRQRAADDAFPENRQRSLVAIK